MDMGMEPNLQKNNFKRYFFQKRSNWIFFSLPLLSILPILYLFLSFEEAGFGYDIGIYHRTAIDYYASFFNPKLPGFAFSAFSNFIFSVGDSVFSFLREWYILLAFFTSMSFGIYIKKITQSTLVAVISIVLLGSSIIHFEFLQAFYYRNLLGFFLMFVSLLLFEYKSYLVSIPLITLTAIHPLTALVIFPCILSKIFFQKIDSKLLLTTFAITTLGAFILSAQEFLRYFHTFIEFTFNNAEVLAISTELTGQFIHFFEFLQLTAPYLPFAVIGLYKFWSKYSFWTTFVILNITLILSKFFLFERYYVFLNIGIIFFAALGINFLLSCTPQKYKIPLILIYVYILVFAQWFYILNDQNTISHEELKDIKGINELIPEKSSIVSWSSYYAPWIYGFSGNHKIIAPGVLHENKWDYSTWKKFWMQKDAHERKEMLKIYGEDEIYIYSGKKFLFDAKNIFENDPHMESITPTLWKYRFSL